VKRRELLTLLGGATVAAPRVARAQQKAMRVIGFLGGTSPDGYAPLVSAFRQGLSTTGYVEGQNVAIEYRWAEDHYERLPALAADLVGRKVDAIVTAGGPPTALAAKRATSTIPIVFAAVGDPVGAGLVASLARPGGNITGMSILVHDLTPKRLELISEMVPQSAVLALLINPANATHEGLATNVQQVAREKGVQLAILRATNESEIAAAYASLAERHAGALILGPDALFTARRDQVVALASHYGVPAIYYFREFAAVGGLISYGPSIKGVFHEAGVYTGRILKGEKPADLPVEQPSTFELVINLRTAKALGLTVPQSLLTRADEVIE
jgi:putative ABC transport system substrate-binding protein